MQTVDKCEYFDISKEHVCPSSKSRFSIEVGRIGSIIICSISGEAAGEIGNWSFLGVKGLRERAAAGEGNSHSAEIDKTDRRTFIRGIKHQLYNKIVNVQVCLRVYIY